MKKLSIVFTVMFVIGMMVSSALAQDCKLDVDCIAPLKCVEGQCVECTASEDCDDGIYCNGEESCNLDNNTCLPGVSTCDEDEVCNTEDDVCVYDGETDGKTVSVEIKPGSCPNPLNVRSRGVLPVAVLGTEEFDVTTIDPDTIVIVREGIDGEVPVIRYSYEDVATPFEGELCDCDDLNDDDINGDGYMDLTLKFRVPELVDGLDLYEVESREIIPLKIMGETEDGTLIMGEDCIRIINKLKWWQDKLKKPKKPKK
jgi:hypothetical protein